MVEIFYLIFFCGMPLQLSIFFVITLYESSLRLFVLLPLSFTGLKPSVIELHRGYATGLILILFVFTGCRAVGSALFSKAGLQSGLKGYEGQ